MRTHRLARHAPLALATVLTAVLPLAVVAQTASLVAHQSSVIDVLETVADGASRAYATNAQGWVVGQADDAEGRTRAVMWSDTGVTDLGTLGGDEAASLAVNDAGQVVGFSATVLGEDLEGPATRAFLWEDGRMTDLGTLGGASSTAHDINSAGQVVGASTATPDDTLDLSSDGVRAFLWENGRMTDLGTLGGDWSWAFAINERGQIVGAAGTRDGEAHAFLWENGRMTDLGTLGGNQSVAFDVNEAGQVVGGSTTERGQEFGEAGTRAFLWERGQMTDLGAATGIDGIAFGINERGAIVGLTPEFGAVLWRGEVTAVLADLLPPATGWDALDVARAIDDTGQVAGWGRRGDAIRAFSLLSPANLATPAARGPQLGVFDVVQRAKEAIRQAGTYRYAVYSLGNAVDPDRIQTWSGEVDLARGVKSQAPDGTHLEYFDGRTLYEARGDGAWKVRELVQWEPLYDFLGSAATDWELLGNEVLAGETVYVIQRTFESTDPVEMTETFWIDAETFLPSKRINTISLDEFEVSHETLYTDFGAPVDVRPPAAALLPTPTPQPLPETAGGRIEIDLLDISFEPKQVTIPANVDVVIVLANVGAAPHNFSIDELGIGVDVDSGTSDFVIVNASPGEYAFHCTVPGHTEAGMVGTLTVRE